MNNIIRILLPIFHILSHYFQTVVGRPSKAFRHAHREPHEIDRAHEWLGAGSRSNSKGGRFFFFSKTLYFLSMLICQYFLLSRFTANCAREPRPTCRTCSTWRRRKRRERRIRAPASYESCLYLSRKCFSSTNAFFDLCTVYIVQNIHIGDSRVANH